MDFPELYECSKPDLLRRSQGTLLNSPFKWMVKYFSVYVSNLDGTYALDEMISIWRSPRLSPPPFARRAGESRHYPQCEAFLTA